MSTHYPNFSKSSAGLGSVFKSITKSLKSTSNKNVPVQINATVVGGGHNQQKLLQNLQSGTLPSRATAAASVTESIEKYSISSIPEIWYLARDMCNYKLQSHIRRTTLKLLIQCIIHDEGSVSSRLMFFRDIIGFCQFNEHKVDPEFDLFLTALIHLTNDGRDIYDFCIYDQEENLRVFLDICLRLLGNNLKTSLDHDSEEELKNDKDFQNLVQLIQFCRNCFKFNFSLLDETAIASIIISANNIGTQTKNKIIISNIIDLLDAAIVFGFIPSSCLASVIEFFSLKSYETGYISQQTWKSISHLCIEPTFHFIISNICNVISNKEIRKHRSVSSTHYCPIKCCIGAIKLIERISIFSAFENPSNIESNFALIFNATFTAISYNLSEIHTAYLESFERLFSKSPDIENFGMQPTYVLDRIFPFQLWYSKTHSIFDILKALKVNSEKDVINMKSICSSLRILYDNHELQFSKRHLVDFYLVNHSLISSSEIKFVLNYYNEEKLCSPLCPLWRENCYKILKLFFYTSSETEVKIECLKLIKKGFQVANSLLDVSSLNYDIIFSILKRCTNSGDNILDDYVISNIFTDIALTCPINVFNEILMFIGSGFQTEVIHSEGFMDSVYMGSSTNQIEFTFSHKFSVKIIVAICKIFLICITEDSLKAQKCFELLIEMSRFAFSYAKVDLLLVVCKCLIRLRATNENNIYVTNPTDMDGLSTTFRRNALETNFEDDNYEWVYPETLEFIPEKYLNLPSSTLKLFQTGSEKSRSIDLSKWFSLVLEIMQSFLDWEIYSFIWAHFCSQLSNINLFQNNDNQIKELKNTLCDQLKLNLPPSLVLPNYLTKADLQVAFVRTMSALLGYRDCFLKHDEDQIINCLIFGLSSWEKTAIPCINILSVCCFEMPQSIKKFSSLILTKLQTRVTSASTSAHTLEFLMSLINLPSLTSNFSIDEFKRVFGIAFKYIQYCHDIKKRKAKEESSSGILQQHGLDAEVEQSPSTTSTEITPIFSQYLLSLSYNVISSWFLKLSINERKQISSFLVRNLIISSEIENELDEQTIAYLDLIIRYTFSDIPSKIYSPPKPASGDNQSINRWIIGNSILSIETNILNGESNVIIRRPTGVTSMKINLDMIKASDRPILNSNYILLQLFNNIDNSNRSKPIPLIEDSITLRALSMIDRIPTVEFHKIGIIYIGKMQSTENEVLSNSVGSKSHHDFLKNIGRLIKLKNCKEYYVGGLDIENNVDGEYALFWDNKTTQVIFHTTTLMKNHKDDKYCDFKKKHIGNNHVNIYFDESTLPFNFNLIKSQFSFMNIVITPHSMSTTIDNYTTKRVFKVKLYRRAGVPGVFSACHFKMITEDHLADYVRNLAIMADQFANIWHSSLTGSYLSNWSYRVRQIDLLKSKMILNHKLLQEEQQKNSASSSTPANTTHSFLKQLDFGTSLGSSNETKFEYITSANENELYSLLEFNSYTS